MRTLLVLFLAPLASTAFAQDSIYVGIGFGDFDYSESTGDLILGKVAANGAREKIFGGFEFNEHFTLEVSYSKTGDLTDSNTTSLLLDNDTVPDEVTGTLTTDFTITTLNAIGQLPFDWGALMGGLGYFSSDSGFSAVATAECCGMLSNSGSISDNGLSAMLGAEWRFGRFGTRYGVRLEYEWWDMADVDTSMIGLAFSYGF